MSSLSKWYRGLTLPWWGEKLISFMTPSAGLLSTLLPVNVPIFFDENEITAYADRERNRIVLGTNFLSANKDARLNPLATKEEAITFALGCAVHEGCHFAWSPVDIPALLNRGVPHNSITGAIANVVEDIYIEDRLIKNYPLLAWMILGAWDYMFAVPSVIEGLAKWDGVSLTSAPVKDMLPTFIYWKYQSIYIAARSDDERMLQDLFYSVRGMDDLQDRKNLIEKICRLFAQDADASEDAPSQLEGKVWTATNQQVNKRLLPRSSKYWEAASSQVTPTSVIDEIVAVESESVTVVIPGSLDAKIPFDKRWVRFADVAKQRGAVRSVAGAATFNAKRLTHPANLVTSGKVFSKNTLQSTAGKVGQAKPEVLLLLDMSASMDKLGKYQKTIAAAYGAVTGMIDAGMNFAVYGYTSDSVHVTNVMIKIKGFKESPSIALRRLSHLAQVRFPGSMTPDIVALQFAAKQFLTSGSDRVMIVITDGEPSFDKTGKQSDMRLLDSRENVRTIRKSGIKVFGLSIDQSADKSVRYIYDDDALCSSDPNAIEQFLSRFI